MNYYNTEGSTLNLDPLRISNSQTDYTYTVSDNTGPITIGSNNFNYNSEFSVPANSFRIGDVTFTEADFEDMFILLTLFRDLPADHEFKQMFDVEKSMRTLRGDK